VPGQEEIAVIRNICVYTLLMLIFAFAGTALARPETPVTGARPLPAFDAVAEEGSGEGAGGRHFDAALPGRGALRGAT
jgi:hypothetical protein